jgi:predicted MFS family arabinose efflux permease
LVLTCALGCAAIVLAFAGFTVGHAQPVAELVSLGLDSMGLATILAGTQLVVLLAVSPAESGIAVGLSVVLYAVGNSVGSAVFGVLFASFTTRAGQPALPAYLIGFALCGTLAVVALLLCWPMAGQRETAVGPSLEGVA